MRSLVRSKACKRCGGDLSLEYDEYGIYVECIQCGANWSKKELMNPSTPKTQKVEKDKPIIVTNPKH